MRGAPNPIGVAGWSGTIRGAGGGEHGTAPLVTHGIDHDTVRSVLERVQRSTGGHAAPAGTGSQCVHPGPGHPSAVRGRESATPVG